jgi:hypothetical protein
MSEFHEHVSTTEIRWENSTQEALSNLRKSISARRLDRKIWDAYGHEPLHYRLERLIKTIPERLESTKNAKEDPTKFKELVWVSTEPLFSSLRFFSTNPYYVEESEKKLLKWIVDTLWILPSKLIKEHFEYIVTWIPFDPSKDPNPHYASKDTERVSLWQSSRRDKVLRMTPVYTNWNIFILGNTILHEATHAILLHDVSGYWIKKWGERFPDEKWHTQSAEAMANYGGLMLTRSGWEEIRKIVSKETGAQERIDFMKSIFSRISNGLMDEPYWKGIESWTISNMEQAQSYFQGKLKKSSLTPSLK